MFGFTANDMDDMTKAVADFCALRAEKVISLLMLIFSHARFPAIIMELCILQIYGMYSIRFRHSWRPFTAGDEDLSIKIVGYWTNFAKFGNPNGKEEVSGLHTPEFPEFMIFDADEEKAICIMSDTPEFKGPSPRK